MDSLYKLHNVIHLKSVNENTVQSNSSSMGVYWVSDMFIDPLENFTVFLKLFGKVFPYDWGMGVA